MEQPREQVLLEWPENGRFTCIGFNGMSVAGAVQIALSGRSGDPSVAQTAPELQVALDRMPGVFRVPPTVFVPVSRLAFEQAFIGPSFSVLL